LWTKDISESLENNWLEAPMFANFQKHHEHTTTNKHCLTLNSSPIGYSIQLSDGIG
jgi:hypothetical protein